MNNSEKKILAFLKAREWDNLRPSDLAKSIIIEGAELLELFQCFESRNAFAVFFPNLESENAIEFSGLPCGPA